MLTKLLQEDDCAPDARESFIKEMKKEFGINYADFFRKGLRIDVDELCTQWRFNGYILEFNVDDPYSILYKGD